LPRLPVPSLSDTINRYLESMRPVLEEVKLIIYSNCLNFRMNLLN
jgi:hypothetical protein